MSILVKMIDHDYTKQVVSAYIEIEHLSHDPGAFRQRITFPFSESENWTRDDLINALAVKMDVAPNFIVFQT